ncbi:Putative F0F1-ATPase subunit Ca2+/Mg2+ transporter [Fictibacillus enclensis]|nr:Putative F0F1-ATPase subunit Ca2+/Mg2+ transporter [Fictibacillus enclensis]
MFTGNFELPYDVPKGVHAMSTGRRPYKAMALMSSILSVLVGSILLGLFGGKWLDGHMGTSPLFLIIGLFIGLGAGVYGMIRLLSNRSGEERK